jgi:hypothetical protein
VETDRWRGFRCDPTRRATSLSAAAVGMKARKMVVAEDDPALRTFYQLALIEHG